MNIKKMKRILFINSYGIGDVLFSTPFLRNLHSFDNTIKIYYLANKRCAPLLENHPLIEKVFIYERDEFEAIKKESFVKYLKNYWDFICSIRKEKIDTCFDVSLSPKFGYMSILAGIRNRVGLSYKRRGYLLTEKVPCSGFIDRHVCEYYLDMLRYLKIPVKKVKMELFVSLEVKQWATDLINAKKINGRPLISIAACGGQSFGNSAFIKRWPIEYFAQLINLVVKKFNAYVCVLAGPNEKKEVQDLLDLIDVKDSVFEATEYSISEVAAIVDLSEVVIANDTGPLRFADALEKKIVALFGPVDEKVYGLYTGDVEGQVVLSHDIHCRPCYRKFRLKECEENGACLRKLSVADVFSAVDKLMKLKVMN